MDAVDAEIETFSKLAAGLRQPRYLWLTPHLHASRALSKGKFEECERLAREAVAIGERAHDTTANLLFETLMMALRMVQGQVGDREEAIKRYMQVFPDIPNIRATLANLYFRLGKREDARREFEEVAANDFADLPRDGSWLVTMANLAYVCSYVHDVRRAGILYGYLLPFSSSQLVIGSSAIGVGSIQRFLGIFATTLARWEEADSHFKAAMEMNIRIKAAPYIAFTHHEYGLMLFKRNGPGDRERAFEMFDQALSIANEIGMNGIIRDITALKLGVGG